MKRIASWIIALCVLAAAPVSADPSSPGGSPAADGSPVPKGIQGDPCAVVSQADVASAAGVATNQVFAPTKPTKNECVWAIANKSGTGAQQIALTMQTVDQVKQSRGIARFGAILSAAKQIPGVTLPTNPVVQHAFDDAQVVVGIGDKAGWKNGTLSVLKNETLVQVSVAGPSDSQSLAISKKIATSAVQNINTTAP